MDSQTDNDNGVFQYIKETFTKQWGKLGILGTVSSFVSDVLQPIAPFSKYLFFISIILIVALFIAYKFGGAISNRHCFSGIVFSIIVCVISGSLLLFQSSDKAESSGVLAGVIPGIAKMQENLGVIEKDLGNIKKDTADIKVSTNEIASNTREMVKGIQSLGKSGGLIANPSKPEEFYHNARVYETDGDYLNARKSYARFFSFNLMYLDPHLRYQTFLKVQEGKAGAREIYSDMSKGSDNLVVNFSKAILFSGDEKKKMLESFTKKQPEFAPVYYELSLEYSENRLGSQALTDKRMEKTLLNRFLELSEQGHLLKYFLDHDLAATWIEDAKTRLSALKAIGDDVLENPVTFSAILSTIGWSLDLSIGEPVRKILYRVDETEPFKDTGVLDYIDPRIGAKMPNYQITLPKSFKKGSVSIKYHDINDQPKGPFKLDFDADVQIVASQKRIIEMTKNNWVNFQKDHINNLSVTINFVSYRCAISEVRYSLNSTDLDRKWELAPCDMDNPLNGSSDNRIILTEKVSSLSLQITYKDNTKSGVETFMNQ
ncbi:MAG: hypothetical protein H7833_03075 [Magnetococcus sp. DMHC-1]|nr:hypothetical protein [Magnetococcales bacterium]